MCDQECRQTQGCPNRQPQLDQLGQPIQAISLGHEIRLLARAGSPSGLTNLTCFTDPSSSTAQSPGPTNIHAKSP